MPVETMKSSVMLWGIEPQTYPRGSLAEQRPGSVRGMHGYYHPISGLFVPLSLSEVAETLLTGLWVGNMYTDGDGTLEGLIATPEGGEIDNENVRTLEGHIGHQTGLPWPAVSEGRFDQEQALFALSASGLDTVIKVEKGLHRVLGAPVA